MMKKNILLSAAAAFALSLLLVPSPARAQCDIGASGVASACQATEKATVEAMTQTLKELITSFADGSTGTTTKTLLDLLDKSDQNIIGKLDWWWNNLGNKQNSDGSTDKDALPALQTMIQQLHSSVIDQSRQRESDMDGDNAQAATRQRLQQEYEAVKTYQPSNQTCQFDTVAKSLGNSAYVSRALTTGYALDFNKIGQASKNSPAGGGPQTLQKARIDIYKSKFCDPTQNAGHAGCTTPGTMVGADVQPSKTVFGHDTIDMTNADTNTAVNQLLFNITGYEAPAIIPPSAVNSNAGLQQRQKNREYAAQMDSVSALAAGVVAERAPGEKNDDIYDMRDKVLAPHTAQFASHTPSHREIRAAIVEQLWDPGYYVELGDRPATMTQKELYLKAYALVMLYDMIAKQEKISTAYAIETSNMLEKLGAGRGGSLNTAPVQ